MKIFKKEKITNDNSGRRILYRDGEGPNQKRKKRPNYDNYYEDYDDDYSYYENEVYDYYNEPYEDEYATREYNSGKHDRYETRRIQRPKKFDDDVYYYEDEYEYYDSPYYENTKNGRPRPASEQKPPNKKKGCGSFAFGCFIFVIVILAILLALLAAILGGIKPLFTLIFNLIGNLFR